MDKGAAALARILLISFIFGLIVLIAHPEYRGTITAMLSGAGLGTPIWVSNEQYYPEVTLQPVSKVGDEHAE